MHFLGIATVRAGLLIFSNARVIRAMNHPLLLDVAGFRPVHLASYELKRLLRVQLARLVPVTVPFAIS